MIESSNMKGKEMDLAGISSRGGSRFYWTWSSTGPNSCGFACILCQDKAWLRHVLITSPMGGHLTTSPLSL